MISLIVMNCRGAIAYYDDTHYGVTYYLARIVGYTPEQSQRLASATVSVDYSKATEPVQGENMIVGPPGSAQTPRVSFHAFLDEVIYPDCQTNIEERRAAMLDVKKRERFLFQQAVKSRNPGVFFHFYQDEFSHSGYGSWGGHFASRTANKRGLPIGSYTDWLSSYDPAHHMKAIDATIEMLKSYMKSECPIQFAHLHKFDRAADVESLLAALIKANPWTYGTPSGSVALPKVPDYGAAYKVIGDALRARGDRSLFPGKPISYQLDRHGNISQALYDSSDYDPWTLWGDLDVLVSKAGEVGSATVRVMILPTFQQDRAYEFAHQTLAAASSPLRLASSRGSDDRATPAVYRGEEPDLRLAVLPSVDRTLDFTIIPVGQIAVEVTGPNCVPIRVYKSINKLHDQMTVTLKPPSIEVVVAKVVPERAGSGQPRMAVLTYKITDAMPPGLPVTIQEDLSVTGPQPVSIASGPRKIDSARPLADYRHRFIPTAPGNYEFKYSMNGKEGSVPFIVE